MICSNSGEISSWPNSLASNEVLTTSQLSPCSCLLVIKLSSPHLRLASQKLEEKKKRGGCLRIEGRSQKPLG